MRRHRLAGPWSSSQPCRHSTALCEGQVGAEEGCGAAAGREWCFGAQKGLGGDREMGVSVDGQGLKTEFHGAMCAGRHALHSRSANRTEFLSFQVRGVSFLRSQETAPAHGRAL